MNSKIVDVLVALHKQINSIKEGERESTLENLI